MQVSRIFIVDDHEPFRGFVCSTLRQRAEFEVVGQASDGLEAIQKAKELQPDLILLDIGLPKLSGLEAGRQIRTLCPTSKILFVSQESSNDVIEETFRVGGHGYVLKQRAGSDLLPAIEVVLGSKQFVGSGRESSAGTKVQVPHRHEILFCTDDTVLLDSLNNFILSALRAGNAAIVFVSEPHRERLAARLRGQGMDVDAAIQQGTYIPVSVQETLPRFTVNGWPDGDRFSKLADSLVKRASEGATGERRRVVACGECSPTLWTQGNVQGAVRLEHLFDEVSGKHQVDMLCVYPLLNGQEDDPAFKSLCAEHTAVYSR